MFFTWENTRPTYLMKESTIFVVKKVEGAGAFIRGRVFITNNTVHLYLKTESLALRNYRNCESLIKFNHILKHTHRIL